ncbi:MAG: hypothetical protein JWN73_394 [Betaproteobacteria bacterium]|nr:hypothetical protein [Betaproteobacteria bacterium]
MSSANAMAATMLHKSDGDRNVTVSRLIDAPRELVFAAWTDPRHVVHWWRPQGFAEIHLDEMDVKVGGVLRFRMRTADGVTFNSRCVYREISAPSHLRYDEQCDVDGKLFHQGRQTVTFEAVTKEQRDQTLLTIHTELSWVPGRDPAFTPEFIRAGWQKGWGENFDLLESYLPDANFVSSPGNDLVLSRQLAAPRALVFAAWTDPTQLAQWWGPKSFTNVLCASDPRPGGAWNVTMRAPDGQDYPIRGTYVEVVPNERLVIAIDLTGHPPEWHAMIRKFRSEHGEAPDAPGGGLTLIVTLEDRAGGTWLTVTDRFGNAGERDAHRDLGAVQGWAESLESLVALLHKH